ncbi:MAG: tetratricopeptide repeat protein [Saprospiraceae bacterium]|nr:tetratricopeptide repeat protein [Saprospiraceae bacterium]
MIDFYELIEDYIENKLTSGDKERFENELRSNPKLREAVENYPLAKKISASLIEFETRNQLKELQSKKSLGFRIMRIAAILIPIIVASYWIYLENKKQSYDSELIFADLYHKPIAVSSRSEEVSLSTLDTAILLFDNKKYNDAKIYFEKIDSSHEKFARALYYLAHIEIESKNFEKAKKIFLEISKNSNNELDKKEAIYNLMILSLKNSNINEARNYYNDNFKDSNYIGEETKNKLSRIFK